MGILGFFRQLFDIGPPVITPRTTICQKGRGPGQVGCFAELLNGSTVALTAHHLFDGSTGNVNRHDGFRCLGVIGDTLMLPTLDRVNSSEGATFSPVEGSILRGHELISEGFANEVTIRTAEMRMARSLGLSDPGLGLVLDTDATISYPMPGYPMDRLFIFDSQILIRDADTRHSFGVPGDSGALVVLNEGTDALEMGDALGLYTWTDQVQYHFVTPFFLCASKFGIAKIKNRF
jgi:hypothetical protein